MTVRAETEITLARVDDGQSGKSVTSMTAYYLAQDSALSPPTFSAETISGWSTSQPALDLSKTCYIAFLTTLSDSTLVYSVVTVLSEYEAAKTAFTLADQANTLASDAYDASVANRYTYYAYSESSSGFPLSFSDNSLPYRGICITTDTEAPEDAGMYRWEVNPNWASLHAEKYLHDIQGGMAIYSDDLGEDTYAGLSALALTFYLAGIQQMKVGYDASIEAYGVIAQSLIALGSGAGVRFDNFGHSNTGARGRFTWEVRDNGHFTMKLY